MAAVVKKLFGNDFCIVCLFKKKIVVWVVWCSTRVCVRGLSRCTSICEKVTMMMMMYSSRVEKIPQFRSSSGGSGPMRFPIAFSYQGREGKGSRGTTS